MGGIKKRVLAGLLSAAITVAALEAVTPTLFDWILELIGIGLVWLAAKLAAATPE
ncbi:hypothetical protein [uncultured Pelagimonas sp.]|uniref:hypothetical protein n=1 Tax=uncultured Pelagimonas sp. TaxID=1618102 RepID=UPI00260F753D|nr:hypothetical protein [uncultured Pelagimonas sp.]